MTEPSSLPFSEHLLRLAEQTSGADGALRSAFGDAFARDILAIARNLISTDGRSFEEPEELSYPTPEDEDALADAIGEDPARDFFDRLRERQSLRSQRLAEAGENAPAREVFLAELRRGAATIDDGVVAMEVITAESMHGEEDFDGEADGVNSLMLLAGRRTGRIFGALPLPPGADTPELVIEETLKSPAVRGLDPILHLSEDHGLEEVLREMHCRRTPVLQRAGDPGSAMAPVLAAAKEKLRTAPELFPDDPESRGVTDVSLSQPSPELTPVHLSVVEDESGERARQESREELEGIMRKLNASGNLSDLSEYEQELARGFLVPEKAAGDAFRCRVDEERFAEVTAHFGILWFLSNFSLSVAEERRLEMIRLSAEEFLNAESEEFDENSFSRDMSASLEELEGRRFVKFCALLIAQELGRIFLRARERLAELDSETAEDEVVKHLRETLASNSQADILAALDRAVREAGDEGREIIERVFAPVSD